MLSATEAVRARRLRPPPSLMQQYQEYVMQRIEGYKNSIERDELLRLGDEAVSEMQATAEGQFVLTEVLMLESVDRLIMKRLALRPYRRWRQQYLNLRAAQRQPTHWGLEPDCPLAALLPRIEPEDRAVAAGAGAASAAFLLAAHDAEVTFIASDLGAVERVESAMASESLAGAALCYFVQPGCWMPDFGGALSLVVLDAGSLADVDLASRAIFLNQLQEQTAPGGVHVIMSGTASLAPDALLGAYDGWQRDDVGGRRRRGVAARSRGLVLTKMEAAEGERVQGTVG